MKVTLDNMGNIIKDINQFIQNNYPINLDVYRGKYKFTSKSLFHVKCEENIKYSSISKNPIKRIMISDTCIPIKTFFIGIGNEIYFNEERILILTKDLAIHLRKSLYTNDYIIENKIQKMILNKNYFYKISINSWYGLMKTDKIGQYQRTLLMSIIHSVDKLSKDVRKVSNNFEDDIIKSEFKIELISGNKVKYYCIIDISDMKKDISKLPNIYFIYGETQYHTLIPS